MTSLHRWSWRAWLAVSWLLAAGGCVTPALAAPTELHGRWFAITDAGLREPVERLAPTGGRFEYRAELRVVQDGTYVLDFKNSSVIGRFRHRLADDHGRLVAELAGGLQSAEPNPFFLRHGRELSLAAGHYQLVSELDSPFFLAQPEPYLDTLAHYRQAIKPGNALVLLCLGVFIGLGVYYASLALYRRRLADAMYACFIAGNLLYNGTALLVAGELFDLRWFYLISVPILFSNVAYVVFVMALLQIRRASSPWLHGAGRALIGLLTAFIALAALRPHWSLELDRIGVGLFLVFGLAAGVRCVWRGDKLARLYLAANLGFFVSGFAAISLIGLAGVYTSYVEHLGLVAVTIEVLLLALVLSYQFGLLQKASQSALARAEHHLHLARTDVLTGLPNRYALELALGSLPPQGSLTFVDIDGLKHYNDRFGHSRGDQLLRDFATTLSRRLGTTATLHRLGGDEFAATSHHGALEQVERMVAESVVSLQRGGYEDCGASCGSVRVHECSDSEQLKHLADTRMYEHKRRRRVRDHAA
ncbi:MAG TPA: diguanylate cyclase [Albitalea sp.]|uniref:sensor domain-containing diguanylate cyclase n=1 Tax=Piscinibacter sp. TaxID=1903157 RepID=UPI002ED63D8F